VDGMRLKGAQKHRLASQNEDCHSKKHFQELPQVLRWCKKKAFCEDTGIHVFGEFFGVF
jgi:hypothetical protein